MEPAVEYCRVSSKEQEESGYSLPAQEALLGEYAGRKGFKVVKVFSVAESASGEKQRKVFKEMLEFMETNKVKHLLCEKVDRITRNMKEAVAVNDWAESDKQRRIHFVKQNLIIHKEAKSDEKFRWDIEVVLAKKYISNLSEEVKKGQEQKLKEGWLPTKPPIGYMTVGEKGKKIHLIDQTTSHFVKKAFTLYGSGNYSMSAVAEELFKDGFRTRSGRKPVKSRIEDMLGDEFYYGAMKWKGILYVGHHEPLLTKELFDKVQDVRLGRKSPHYKSHEYLFRKMFVCGECRGTITAQIQRGIVYYNCNHYRQCSQKKYTPECDIEDKLVGAFEFFKSITPDEAEDIKQRIRADHAEETLYKENQIKSFQEQYNRLQGRLDRMYDDKLDGRISNDFWQIKQKEIIDEQASIQKDLEKLKTQEAKYFEIWLNIMDLAFRAGEIYEKRTPEEKRLLLRHLFSNMRLLDKIPLFDNRKAVEVLMKRVQQRLDQKKTFEHNKTVGNKRQKDSFESLSPLLLPR